MRLKGTGGSAETEAIGEAARSGGAVNEGVEAQPFCRTAYPELFECSLVEELLIRKAVEKSEIRISKLETNSKFEFPKNIHVGFGFSQLVFV